jgi:hypothetical protein
VKRLYEETKVIPGITFYPEYRERKNAENSARGESVVKEYTGIPG